MKVLPTFLMEREGVLSVALRVTTALGWIFREQGQDFGVDAVVEIVKSDRSTGQLLAVQVKSGASYTSRGDDATITVAVTSGHLDLWLNFVLPVVLVVYDPTDRTIYWQAVTEDTTRVSGANARVVIPRSQLLDGSARGLLTALATGGRRLFDGSLESVLSQVRALAIAGEATTVELAEWINKSSGRTDVKFFHERDDGEIVKVGHFTLYFGGLPLMAGLQHLLPWSELTLDDETYECADRERFDDEEGIWDSEVGKMIHFSSFDEWRAFRFREPFRPYSEDGEIAQWRVRIALDKVALARDIVSQLSEDHPSATAWWAVFERFEEGEIEREDEQLLAMADGIIDRLA